MKLHPLIATVLTATFLVAACGSDTTARSTDSNGENVNAANETTRLWIRPDLVDCEGAGPQKCMEIAETRDGDYELFYDGIEGFTFQEGTTYVVDVTIDEVADPPADGSSEVYALVKVIEQTEPDE